MLNIIQTSAEPLLFRHRQLIDHYGLILFLKDGIECGLVNFQIASSVRTRHFHSVEAKNDMEWIDEIMGMLGVRKYPARIGIVYLQIGVEATVIDFNTPVFF